MFLIMMAFVIALNYGKPLRISIVARGPNQINKFNVVVFSCSQPLRMDFSTSEFIGYILHPQDVFVYTLKANTYVSD